MGTIIDGIQTLGILWLIYRLHDVEHEVKKGNKDQQEIKTKLTWIKKRQMRR